MTAPTSRWSLFGLLAQQRRFIYLAVALLSAAGIWAAYTLPSAIYPELQFYRVTIVAEGSSLGARQQLFGVTRTLEEAVSIVPGVIRVQSKSIRGASEINVMFSPTTDMVDALQQVRARVAQVQPELPTGLDIVTERQVPSLFPILSYNLEGGDPATLFDIARYQVKPVLSRVPGVGRIEVLGNDMREIEVVADPARLAAQAVPTAPAPRKDDEIVSLSPFTVVSDEKGYQAFNTLAGTRINSKLEDLGSSITVITKQQMEDLALLDINDVFRYEASTEGTDNFTTFNRNRSGGVNDQIQSDPARANRVRGVTAAGQSVGGANTAWGTFTSNSNIPFDPYNISAVEISRGPNSNLFGLGQAAGTVSVVPSQANVSRRAYSADVRVDSFGGHRESFNVNTPLLPGKVGFRVAGVNESKGFERKPSSERISRGFATLLVQPFRNTTFRASAERYLNDYRRPNSITARDTTAEWKAAGSPSWDPVTMMVTYANGTKAGPFAADSTSVTLPGLGISTTQ